MEVTEEDKKKMLDTIGRMIELDQATPEVDEHIKQQLGDFFDMACQQLAIRIGLPDKLPSVLQYIIINVVVRYFNLKGKEGTKKFGQEGESVELLSNMLDGYTADIAAYLERDRGPKYPSASFY